MKWRIWLLSLGITLVCVLTFGVASTQAYYQSSIDDSKRFLRVYMNAFDPAAYALDAQGAKDFSQKLNGARVTFMDAQGNVLADSLAQNADANHADRAEIQSAVFEGEGFAVRGSSTLGKNMVYFCKNFNGDYLVRVAVFTDSDWRIFARTLPLLALFSGVMLALSAVVATAASHFILNPVKKLAAQAVDSRTVTAECAELQPVADILNERNRNLRSQMQALQAEQEAAEKARASKDEFISNVTHEMNTPLTSIHGYAELLQAGGLSEGQKQQAYQTVLTQSERLIDLIACIINYNKIDTESLPSYAVDLSALAKETLQALRPAADKRNIRLIQNIEDNVILQSRHELLSEILGNLVRNAIKYNRDGGAVTVTVTPCLLSVADTGIGIAPENLPKVFSRFFTVDRSHNGKNGGFGLGLAVVKKICKASGWDITVQSEPQKGSTFTVRFDT